MMKKIAGLFRRLFKDRGFRRGIRILLWASIAYIIYNLVVYLNAITDVGISLQDAIRFFFSLSPFAYPFAWRFFAVVFLAIVLGLIRYFMGKEESKNTEENTGEEKPAESSGPVQEEELSEPKHYQYH